MPLVGADVGDWVFDSSGDVAGAVAEIDFNSVASWGRKVDVRERPDRAFETCFHPNGLVLPSGLVPVLYGGETCIDLYENTRAFGDVV